MLTKNAGPVVNKGKILLYKIVHICFIVFHKSGFQAVEENEQEAFFQAATIAVFAWLKERSM